MNPNQEPNQPTGQPVGKPSVSMDSIYPSAGQAPTTPPQPNSSEPAFHLGVEPPEVKTSKPKKHHEGWKSTLSTIGLFLLAPIIALSITAFAFQSYQVDGQSMESTLQNNDRLIVNKLPRTISRITHHPYVPGRSDIIVFNQAGLFDTGSNQEKQLIKRVIGLPGDRVIVSEGKVTIINNQHPNGYNPDLSGDYTITAKTTPGEIDRVINKGEIFVMGDNRTNSEDSRYFGPVTLNRIVGKLTFRIIPINKAQRF